MKKYIAIIFLLLTTVQFVKAQSEDFKPYSSFGVKQGLNMSSVLFSPGVSQLLMLGYNGGVVYKYQNERLFGLQVELNYIKKGWTEELAETENTYSRHMNYIEIPFLTHIVMGKKKLKYYVNLGTSFAYLLSEKEDLKVVDEDYRREFYEMEIENDLDYAGIIDAGLAWQSSIGEFHFGFRYQYTFTDLFKHTSGSFYEQSQNSIFAFSISYFIYDNK